MQNEDFWAVLEHQIAELGRIEYIEHSEGKVENGQKEFHFLFVTRQYDRQVTTERRQVRSCYMNVSLERL